jgi:hypothetical protein
MSGPSERDPLLKHDNAATIDADTGNVKPEQDRGLGPLEISRSTRYGILAGIFLSTFLSVSHYFVCVVRSRAHPCPVFEQYVGLLAY